MNDKHVYRIRVAFVGKGIERSLPYEIPDEEVAEGLSAMLNTQLEAIGYHHYIVPAEPVPVHKHRMVKV